MYNKWEILTPQYLTLIFKSRTPTKYKTVFRIHEHNELWYVVNRIITVYQWK